MKYLLLSAVILLFVVLTIGVACNKSKKTTASNVPPYVDSILGVYQITTSGCTGPLNAGSWTMTISADSGNLVHISNLPAPANSDIVSVDSYGVIDGGGPNFLFGGKYSAGIIKGSYGYNTAGVGSLVSCYFIMVKK